MRIHAYLYAEHILIFHYFDYLYYYLQYVIKKKNVIMISNIIFVMSLNLSGDDE